MQPTVIHRLLELNRTFYATVSAPFDQTRHSWAPGMVPLLDYLPVPSAAPLRVLDVGCGNARFARLLEDRGLVCAYTGVDGDPQLLQLAAAQTAQLNNISTHFAQADLAAPGWPAQAGLTAAGYDLVLCLATLHHLPGVDLRRSVMAELAAALAPGGILAISAWQFLSAPRWAAKQIPWSEIGLTAADVEPGDALLPWQQGQYAVRYVHQLDAAEIADLAAHAGLRVIDSYRADGKEGDLNLYTIMGEAA